MIQIGAGGDPRLLFKNGAEILGVGKACLLRHLPHRKATAFQQGDGIGDPFADQVFPRGDRHRLPKQLSEIDLADMRRSGRIPNGYGGLGKMLIQKEQGREDLLGNGRLSLLGGVLPQIG